MTSPAAGRRELIPLIMGVVETVAGLREAGFCVEIVIHSFQVASETVQMRQPVGMTLRPPGRK